MDRARSLSRKTERDQYTARKHKHKSRVGRYNEWPLDISICIYTCIEVYAGHSIVHISEALQKHLIMAVADIWKAGGFPAVGN